MGFDRDQSNAIYPYRNAVLCDRRGDLKKQWIISYYVFDANKDALVRKQKTIPMTYQTVAARKAYAQKIISQLNLLLAAGYHIKKECTQESAKSLTRAFQAAFDIKRNQIAAVSYTTYKTIVDRFVEYIKATKHSDLCTDIDKKTVSLFIDYYQKKYKVSNTTRNNIQTYLSSIFNLMVERGDIPSNPARGIKKLTVKSASYEIFSTEQIKAIMSWMQHNDEILYLYCQCIYYTFIRRKELQRLQVKHFDLKNQMIYIPANISKNRKSESVYIPDYLNKKLAAYFKGHSGSMIAFTAEGVGNSVAHKNYWTYRHQKALDACLIKGPTLYSWKHTGVCNAHLQGVSVIQTMQQCRHSSLDIHYSYLRRLGVIVNTQMNTIEPI